MSVDTLKVLSEPRRQEILRLVWETEKTASDIAACFDVTRPAISQHLKVLREAGLVRVRQEGTKRHYSAVRDKIGVLGAVLEQSWSTPRPIPRAALARPAAPKRDWAPYLD